MSRAVPPVRRWRATYWRAGKVLFVNETAAPTRFLARWEARDAFLRAIDPLQAGLADKVTIAVIRQRKPRS